MTTPIASRPLVSVIIPAHNAQAFIASTVDSVCAQTFRDFEIVVVDDGSRDRTAEIVRAIAERDGRVRLLSQPNLGVAAARNRAIRESRGDYIAPLDADDIWYPRKLEQQVRALQGAAPSVGLVYAWSVYIDDAGRLTGGYYAHDLPRNVRAALIFRNLVGCSSVPLIRRECFDRVGFYNEKYAEDGAQGCEDLDLYLRIAERYEFLVVEEFLVGYRQSNACLSADTARMARSFYFVMRDCMARRPEIPQTVFRWSLSRQCFHLHGRARGYRQYRIGLALLLAAVWFDPSLLARRQFYRGLVAGPLRRLRLRARAAQSAEAVTLSGVAAQRAVRPTTLFEDLGAIYHPRLRFTEQLLERGTRDYRDIGGPALARDIHQPAGEPPA
ncbi:MAG: glycosyltransferase family 2 protein [Sulfurifustaceae bacterium]